jgi:hypothetical protein
MQEIGRSRGWRCNVPKEIVLIGIGYAAGITLALFVALSLRRERYWRPDYYPPDYYPPGGLGCGGGLLLLAVAALAVFIVWGLQP